MEKYQNLDDLYPNLQGYFCNYTSSVAGAREKAITTTNEHNKYLQ